MGALKKMTESAANSTADEAMALDDGYHDLPEPEPIDEVVSTAVIDDASPASGDDPTTVDSVTSEATEAVIDQTPVLPASDFERQSTRISGIIMEHGEAPFNFDDNERNNYFIKLDRGENAIEREMIVWGVDLKRLVNDQKLQVNDPVTLIYEGRQQVQVHVPVRDGNGKIILNGKGKPAQYSQEWVWRNTWGATKEKAEDIPGLVAHQTVNMHDDAIGVASSMENTAFATKNPEKTLVNDLEALKPKSTYSQDFDSPMSKSQRQNMNAHPDQALKSQLHQSQQRMNSNQDPQMGMVPTNESVLAKLISEPFRLASAATSMVASGIRSAGQTIKNSADKKSIKNDLEPRLFQAADKVSNLASEIKGGEFGQVLDEMKEKGIHTSQLFNSAWSKYAEPENQALRDKYDAALAGTGKADQLTAAVEGFVDLTEKYMSSCEKAGMDGNEAVSDATEKVSDAVDGIEPKNENGERSKLQEMIQNLMEKIKEFFNQLTSKFRG